MVATFNLPAGAPGAVPTLSPARDPLSQVFLALADPTRRAMLSALAQGERTLKELAAPFAISLPAVTKHLRILERAGLVARTRQAQRKPCTLQVQPLAEAASCIQQYRQAWEARLDRLDALVMALQAQEAQEAQAAALAASPARAEPGAPAALAAPPGDLHPAA